MQSRRSRRSAVLGLIEGVALGAILVAAIIVGASADRGQQSESGMQAWSDRLQAQAEAYGHQRALDAWSQRLNGLAGAQSGSSDRALDAWSQRLNGLAAQYLAGQ